VAVVALKLTFAEVILIVPLTPIAIDRLLLLLVEIAPVVNVLPFICNVPGTQWTIVKV